ncbi:Wzz/FepE/Etk N-terminal domain-containing protein [Lysobacter enzymogenes]|uniref:Chain-length determining protein n=1 Tax=Lysobacter enzymogenes TaxID=69 RepID=A0A3N2RHQ3_LYSEN|nr:Wzz/FepE/Etk N-terminal domain-containing protein [Lysobacter enzymogenes]ROU06997.1 chain-length determining protein [Lysobacter enzymogenes]
MNAQQDEIYLVDLWRIVRREWRSFAAAALAVLALALVYAALAPQRWQASVWVSVGQLGLVPAGQEPRPEPFQRSVERLQTRAFQDRALAAAGIAADAPAAELYRRSLKVEPSPYAGLIKLSVRAASAQQARLLATTTVAQLQALHRQLQAAPLARARAQLEQARSDLRAALAERERLRGLAEGAQARGGAEPAAALALLALTHKDSEVRQLRQTESDLRARLSGSYTYATAPAWPLHAPQRPLAPDRMLILAVGLLAGLGLGLFAAVARNARRGNPPTARRHSPDSVEAARTGGSDVDERT